MDFELIRNVSFAGSTTVMSLPQSTGEMSYPCNNIGIVKFAMSISASPKHSNSPQITKPLALVDTYTIESVEFFQWE